MGSKKSESTQTSEPPDWAEPLLEFGASEGMNFYGNGTGYSVYTGPTQAPLSPQTLQAMNAIMAATGTAMPKITNESINSQIPRIGMNDMQKRQNTGRAVHSDGDGDGTPDEWNYYKRGGGLW